MQNPTTSKQELEKTFKDTHDYKQAIYAANKALDEPWADPDDDLRTVSRQFLRMIERYDNAVESGKQGERERVLQLDSDLAATLKDRDITTIGEWRSLFIKSLKDKI